jgi:hypothetical protein
MYLSSLPYASLVDLVLFAESRAPHLPLYHPNTKAIVSSLTSKSLAKPPKPIASSISPVPYDPSTTGADSAFDAGLQTPPIVQQESSFPKAGQGVKLPPETDDLFWLMDDDFVTFSHIYRDLPLAEDGGMKASGESSILGVATSMDV